MYGKPTSPTLLKKQCSILIRRYLKRSTIRLCGLVSANQAGVEKDTTTGAVGCFSHSGDIAVCDGIGEGACLRDWLIFWARFVQDRYLSDCAAFSEQGAPSFTVAQVTLSLPLPKPLLELSLHLKSRWKTYIPDNCF